MKRTTRNAAKTKQEIIEKAAPVFNVHGYAGTSMKMLVEATGFQMGGIYRHYSSKMELAREVFRYNFDTLIRPNLEVEPGLSSANKLRKILANYRAMVVQPKIEGGCPVLNTATEVDDTDPVFREMAASYVKEVLTTLEKILTEGIKDGSLRPDLDSRKEALYLYASFEGAILLGKLLRSGSAVFAVFDQIERYLEGHIVTK